MKAIKMTIRFVERYSNGQIFVSVDSEALKKAGICDPAFFTLDGTDYLIPFRIKIFKANEIVCAEMNQVRGVPSGKPLESITVNDEITVLVKENTSIFSKRVFNYYPLWKPIETNGINVNSVIESENKKFRLIKKVAFGYQNLFVDVENDDDEEEE